MRLVRSCGKGPWHAWFRFAGLGLLALLLGACSAKPKLRSELRVSCSDSKSALRASGAIARALDGKGVKYQSDLSGAAISFEFEGTVKQHGLEELLEGLRSSCDVRVKEKEATSP